jgi:hypothetical protein
MLLQMLLLLLMLLHILMLLRKLLISEPLEQSSAGTDYASASADASSAPSSFWTE